MRLLKLEQSVLVGGKPNKKNICLVILFRGILGGKSGIYPIQ